MIKNGKIFRVLSEHPIELEVLEFDDEIKNEDNIEYVDHLEMTLPNEIKL